jgi:hypothetical protein
MTTEKRPCTIPSTLDIRPISERYFNAAMTEAMRKTNKKYLNIESKIDHGMKQAKATEIT